VLAESEVTVPLERFDEPGQRRLEPLAAKAVGGLPKGHERLADLVVVATRSRRTPPRLSRLRGCEHAEGVLAVVARQGDELLHDAPLVSARRGVVPRADGVNQLESCCLAHGPLPRSLSPPVAAGSKVGEATGPAR
jgi:hypothetical protein